MDVEKATKKELLEELKRDLNGNCTAYQLDLLNRALLDEQPPAGEVTRRVRDKFFGQGSLPKIDLDDVAAVYHALWKVCDRLDKAEAEKKELTKIGGKALNDLYEVRIDFAEAKSQLAARGKMIKCLWDRLNVFIDDLAEIHPKFNKKELKNGCNQFFRDILGDEDFEGMIK